MANHHFANVGDVLKHAILAEVLVDVRPEAYVETHAGSLDYPLAGRDPGPGGLWDFLAASSGNATLGACAYTRVLARTVGTPDQPGRYPGSMGLALRLLGPEARYVAYDLDLESCASLETGLREAGATHEVTQGDGLAAIGGTYDAFRLTLIDPFEVDEASPEIPRFTAWEVFAQLAREEPVVLWYPVNAPGQHMTWPAQVAERLGGSVWRAELRWSDREVGIAGCGVMAGGLTIRTTRAITALARALADGLRPRLQDLRSEVGYFSPEGG